MLRARGREGKFVYLIGRVLHAEGERARGR
jgi:hypothetical protein